MSTRGKAISGTASTPSALVPSAMATAEPIHAAPTGTCTSTVSVSTIVAWVGRAFSSNTTSHSRPGAAAQPSMISIVCHV